MPKLANLETPLKNFEGEELKADKGSLTLKKVLLAHLGSHSPEGATKGEEMIRAYNLGSKIQEQSEEIEISSEDAKFILDVVGKKPIFTSLVMGQVLVALQGLAAGKTEALSAVPTGK